MPNARAIIAQELYSLGSRTFMLSVSFVVEQITAPCKDYAFRIAKPQDANVADPSEVRLHRTGKLPRYRRTP